MVSRIIIITVLVIAIRGKGKGCSPARPVRDTMGKQVAAVEVNDLFLGERIPATRPDQCYSRQRVKVVVVVVLFRL